MTAEELIRATIDKLAEAWNANDLKTFLSLFTDDASYITGARIWLRGREAIRDQFSNEETSNGDHHKVVITESSIRLIRSDIAIVQCSWKTAGPGDNQSPLRKGVFTQVLVNDGSGWRIAALHNTDAREEDKPSMK